MSPMNIAILATIGGLLMLLAVLRRRRRRDEDDSLAGWASPPAAATAPDTSGGAAIGSAWVVGSSAGAGTADAAASLPPTGVIAEPGWPLPSGDGGWAGPASPASATVTPTPPTGDGWLTQPEGPMQPAGEAPAESAPVTPPSPAPAVADRPASDALPGEGPDRALIAAWDAWQPAAGDAPPLTVPPVGSAAVPAAPERAVAEQAAALTLESPAGDLAAAFAAYAEATPEPPALDRETLTWDGVAALLADEAFNDPDAVPAPAVAAPPAPVATPPAAPATGGMLTWDALVAGEEEAAATAPASPAVTGDGAVVTDPDEARRSGRFAIGGHALFPGQAMVAAVQFRSPLDSAPAGWRAEGEPLPNELSLAVTGAVNCADEGVEVVTDEGFAPCREGFTVRVLARDVGPVMVGGTFRVG